MPWSYQQKASKPDSKPLMMISIRYRVIHHSCSIVENLPTLLLSPWYIAHMYIYYVPVVPELWSLGNLGTSRLCIVIKSLLTIHGGGRRAFHRESFGFARVRVSNTKFPSWLLDAWKLKDQFIEPRMVGKRREPTKALWRNSSSIECGPHQDEDGEREGSWSLDLDML